MNKPQWDDFCLKHRANGFSVFVDKDWDPDLSIPEHSHEFDVEATVMAGEMWLDVGQGERHLVAGDHFALSAGVRHRERYGKLGAKVWIARRTP